MAYFFVVMNYQTGRHHVNSQVESVAKYISNKNILVLTLHVVMLSLKTALSCNDKL